MTDPVPIRDAATVVLMRDGTAGVDVWLLTRVDQMVFAAGTTVFPGGRVDAADSELPWSGRSPDGLARVSGATRLWRERSSEPPFARHSRRPACC